MNRAIDILSIIIICFIMTGCNDKTNYNIEKPTETIIESDNIDILQSNDEELESGSEDNDLLSNEEKNARIKKIIKYDDIILSDGTVLDLITEYNYSDEDNLIWEFSYDSSGTSLEDKTQYILDEKGNLIEKNRYINEILEFYTIYEYKADKLISETMFSLSDATNIDSNNSYDEDMRITYSYNPDGNLLLEKQVFSRGRITEIHDYEYDNTLLSKEIISIDEEQPLVYSYRYDNLNRVIEKNGSNGFTERYYYDNNSLMVKKIVSVPEFSVVHEYQYDTKGNVIEEWIENDNMDSIKKIKYEYE